MAETISFAFYSLSADGIKSVSDQITSLAEQAGLGYKGPVPRPTEEVKGYKIHETIILLHNAEHGYVDEWLKKLNVPEEVHLEVGYNSRPKISLEDRDLEDMFGSAALQEAKTDEEETHDVQETDDAESQKQEPEDGSKPSEDRSSNGSARERTEGGEELNRLRQEASADSVEEIDPDTVNVGDRVRYTRSTRVKEYVLHRADGHCEGCGEPAPFENKTGNPYLHAHHVYELSEGGSDSPETVIALCPNCHYRIHHGKDGDEYNEELIEKLEEMERE